MQRNPIRGVESTSSGLLDSLTLYNGFSRDCPRLVSISNPKKRLKRFPKGKVSSFLCGDSKSNGSVRSFGYSLKKSRDLNRIDCQGNDSVAYIKGNGAIESSSSGEKNDAAKEIRVEDEVEAPSVDELRELLQKALKDLEVAKLNSSMFEEKALNFAEAAIALKDEAINAQNEVDSTLISIAEIVNEEAIANESVVKASEALSSAEARLKAIISSLDLAEEYEILAAQKDIEECQSALEICKSEVARLSKKRKELEKTLEVLKLVAIKAQVSVLKADEDVTNIMFLAEQAVALELEATQRVNDANISLQKAEKILLVEEEKVSQTNSADEKNDISSFAEEPLMDIQKTEESKLPEGSDQESSKTLQLKETEDDVEKSKTIKQETQKDLTTESSSQTTPKALLKKSSRFFSASFFSFAGDGTEFTPSSVFRGLVESARKELPKVVIWTLLAGTGIALYAKHGYKVKQLFQLPDVTTTSMDEVSSAAEPLVTKMRKLPAKIKKLMDKVPHQEIKEEEASLFDMVWLLLGSVIFVPLFQKIPGGSPVLGYLTAGILIGPYGLSIIHNVHATKAIAEFGVVFLLFNIGLELSVERLSSMKKYVFGLGSAQVLVTASVVGLIAHFVCGQLGPAAIVIGNGLALSSTAVVLQVLQERGESTSRHGRATFSVLLFQDLAVVVLLILIPLISPNSSKGGIGFQAIAEALGLAAVKAIVAISAIIAGGRLLLRPIYKEIAQNQNAEIFSANTLLVILGTSLLTARAGLSMALGAFLAGLLLAETEFSLQVESDIAPYRGLLLGLFFMTVGMSIDPKLLLSNFPVIMGTLGLLIVGKTLLVAVVGKFFGVSVISAIRVGLLLAPGGEFAFVAFGEAVNQGIMSPQLSSLLFLVVGISMALTPWLAAGGQFIASRFEVHDVRSLLPLESETDDLQGHIIICGFGRVGQIIAQLLSERLIPFVALDVRSDRVAVGRALDLPVFFGDAGSREVLHKVGAHRACAAAIALDSPGANYRTVWALSKHFPNVKTFVRAHDVDHGLNLEKAGATAVVPETLEPSLQLAAAVLSQAKLPMSEIAAAINDFRSRHLSELAELSEDNGSSLGYGYSRLEVRRKPKSSDSSDDDPKVEGTLAM
jgi:monovalent cation:proton antiporter-2 (CPA2) family protein